MPLITALVLCLTTQGDPLEAFEGNHQATECAMDFNYAAGVGVSAELCAGKAWHKTPITTVREKRDRCFSGRWETDGLTERCLIRLTEDMLKQRAAEIEAGVGDTTLPDPAEFISDGDLVAYHALNNRYADVYPASSSRFHLIAYKGPYSWWWQKFPEAIKEKWKDAKREYAEAKHGGYATRDIILTMSLDEEHNSLVIAFDPSVGFLPRYARMHTHFKEDDSALVRELWMLTTRRCSSGGFVPTEWFETAFWITSFGKKYATFDHETVFECSSKEAEFVRFSATNFEDRKPELAIVCDEGFDSLHSAGGGVTLSNHPTSLTLIDIRNLLGLRPYAPTPKVPPIATAELEQFDRTENSTWKYILAAALVLIGCIVLAFGYRHYRTASLLVLLAALMTAGCAKPTPALQAHFTDENVHFDPQHADPTLLLEVRNTGNCALVIDKISGDCVCSLVGDTRLPVNLKRGAQLQTKVRVQRRYDLTPRHLSWTIKTDKGNIQCKTSVFMFPTATISPFSRNFQGLEVGEAVNFEIVSHRIWKEDVEQPSVILQVPDKLRAEEKTRRTGHGPVAGYEFEETTYVISIEDSTVLGQHREEIKLQTAKGEALATGMVLWQRVRHVSVVPASVYLSDNKVRLFLRCRDDTVEFLRVVEVPEGINAIVSSPRELSVWPNGDAAKQIDGEIVVETNAASDSVIRIPVLRRNTAPSPARS